MMQPANIRSGSSDPAQPSTRDLLLAAAPWVIAAVVALLALI